ncbi:MAG: hypothetical protein ERJ68_05620, partial [Aphanocapsa feldmannii 277cI]
VIGSCCWTASTDPAAAMGEPGSSHRYRFFADLPIGQTVEIHIELITWLSQPLKLKGRSTIAFLRDSRLVHVDVIAHLCEMYRRSVPHQEVGLYGVTAPEWQP